MPFIGAWSRSEPDAALLWLMTQPDSAERAAASRIAFRPWSRNPGTTQDAIAWVEAQPSAVQTPLLDLVARALVPLDSERAIATAERVEGENRDRVVARVKSLIERREGVAR